MNPARLVLPALRWRDPSGFGHEEAAIGRALELGVGGFILFGGTAEAVAELTRDLQRRAGRPLLFGADLERGAGQQVAGLTELPPPMALAALGDPLILRWAAATTAQEARSVGINWVFAPVADLDAVDANPIVQTRAFGADAGQVAHAVREWVGACQAAGAIACAKHYPGHGRTRGDSHAELPVVDADEATLIGVDALPFDAAIDAGVVTIMTAHVAFPALDPSGLPATLSPAILDRLRRVQGFGGAIVSDALIMEGALVGRTEAESAVAALGAGVDLLLYPEDPAAVVAAVRAAVAGGTLPEARLREALGRAERTLALATAPVPRRPSGPLLRAEDVADRILARGLLRRSFQPLRPPFEIVVVDDDVGGPYPPGPADWVPRGLEQAGVPLGTGGSRVVLAFAEPRAWKGRAGFGPDARAALGAAESADLVVVFGHPRLTREIPGDAPVLVAWHRQRLMQDAVARWLAEHTR